MRASLGGRFAPPPVTDQVVRRSRLFASLTARPVIVVVGAAGYGKSLLLSSWLATAPPEGTLAWLTLDPADEDPGRLAADLLATLRSPWAGATGDAVQALEAPPAFADHLAFVDALHRALADEAAPLTLVLDDVQHLSASPRALALVDRFLAWAPPSTRVLLASRSMPPLRLQRLRLENRLELVERADLAFALEETARAVGLWGLDLGPDTVSELHTLTQGWPAATRLAVLAVRAGGRRRLPLAAGHDVALDDYLTTEVVGALDPDLREFLLDATLDDVVCAPLLDAVRGRSDSAALLERCVAEGLFIAREPGVGDDPWFRWHGLFAAHLRHRPPARPDRHRDAQRRAALWWRTVDPEVAVAHALAAHDDELAGEIAAAAWLDLALSGRAETAGRLAAAVPDGVSTAAELHLAKAFGAAEHTAVDVARAELDAARAASGRLPEHARAEFEMRATVIEHFVVRDRAALVESLLHGHRLLDDARSAAVTPAPATLALAKLHVGMSEARLLDHPLQAAQLLREAEATAAASGYAALGLTARAEMCVPLIATGRLDAGRTLAHEVLAEAAAKGWGDLPGTAMAHGYLAWLALWQGEPERAVILFDRCDATLLPNDWGMRGLVGSIQAMACLSAGDRDGATRATTRCRELAANGRMPPWWPSLQQALDAMVLADSGCLDEAHALVARSTDGPDFPLATCLRASVLLRAGEPETTLQTLDGIPADRLFPHIAALVEVLRAQALVQAGDRPGAHTALERSLGTAERAGFLEPFRMVGTVLAPLLTEHLRTGTSHAEMVARVLGHLVSASPAINEWGDTLTQRERTILRYLATDMSVTEIAAAEFVSTNTIKTHVSHLYRKLEVTNRRTAVREAARLGLL